jgi:poly-gamma-glutamate capsule biosynthesis protein CapA/YwtB (metallophosphatase superfamily)
MDLVFLLKENRPLSKLKTMYGPYGLQESLFWLRKYFRGPAAANPIAAPFPRLKTTLRDFKPRFDIVFVGDLMSLGKCDWQLGPLLSQWVSGAKYLVVNLEAPITANKAYFHLRQFNEARVLDTLTQLKKPECIFLSVANNHVNDFGVDELENSVERVTAGGFNVFGTSASPYAMVGDRVLLYGATQWTNRSAEGLSWLSPDLKPPDRKADLRLLFSHWGYEFELFPRPGQVKWTKNLLRDWDGIIGHHSHCPQPILFLKDPEILKPVAFSLGNFAIAYRKDILNYGLTVKFSIGSSLHSPGEPAPLVIGAVEWSFLKIQKLNPAMVNVELCEGCPFF